MINELQELYDYLIEQHIIDCYTYFVIDYNSFDNSARITITSQHRVTFQDELSDALFNFLKKNMSLVFKRTSKHMYQSKQHDARPLFTLMRNTLREHKINQLLQ